MNENMNCLHTKISAVLLQNIHCYVTKVFKLSVKYVIKVKKLLKFGTLFRLVKYYFILKKNASLSFC